MITYEQMVKPFEGNFRKVIIPKAKMKELQRISSRMASRSSGEFIYSLMGTAAVEEVLKMPISEIMMDNSHDKLHSIIIENNIGIKCTKRGSFPVVFKNTEFAQIICLADVETATVWVCGLATPDVINKYSDDSLLPNDILRVKNVKSGFYGFEHLMPIQVLIDGQIKRNKNY